MISYLQNPRYLEGSNIVAESLRTLTFLHGVAERDRQRSRTGEEDFSPVLAGIAEAGGIARSLDSAELREVLGSFDIIESIPFPPGPGLLEIRIITRVDEVHGGFLESFERHWVRVPQTDPMIMRFMVEIAGERDYLEAENHNLRHYHYCNWRGLRTDVILTFDIANGHKAPVPLFWEKHGEGKARGQAKASAWKERKRRSIHNALSPDLARLLPDTFRRPSNRAENVWPLGVRVSQRR